MSKFIKSILGFIKNNPAIIYSLSLIVFLPLILWWQTNFTISSFEKNIDLILQDKALALENILAGALADKIGFPEVLKTEIDTIASQNPEIKKLMVIVPQDSNFKILAASADVDRQQIPDQVACSLAWSQEQNIAHLKGTSQERFWELIKPVANDKGEKIALLATTLSLKKTDSLIARTAKISYLVILATILISLFLVIQHTSLFKYLKLYRELQKVDAMKDGFMRMAIHELQSPITNIRGYVEILQEDLAQVLSDKQKEGLVTASLSAKNLSDLIYDILAVVKIEQEVLDVSLQEIVPQAIINEIINLTRTKAEKKGLSLNYVPAVDPGWRVRVNSNRFKEILTNLIENAIKYTREGKIEVKEWLDENKKRYYLAVEDTGLGINGEDQKRIFEKFYRVKNQETFSIPGTGLGLWIIKNLCQQMGLEITLESIKGVGSKFVLALPAVKRDAKAA